MHVHVGPFIIAWNKVLTSSTSMQSCPNQACLKHESNCATWKFCPECGAEIAEIQIPIKVKRVEAWKVQESIKEALFSRAHREPETNADLWFSNRKIPGFRPHQSITRDNANEVFIMNPDQEKEMAQFKEFYAYEISQLEQAYGEDNIKIHWGILHLEF